MKNSVPLITTSLLGAGLLAAVISLSIEQTTLAAPPPADPAHAAHVAAGTAPAAAPVPAGLVAAPVPAAPVPADPAHAAHVAAGTAAPVPAAPAALPPAAAAPVPAAPAAPPAAPAAVHSAKGDPVLSQQLSQLQAKVAHLEAALAKGAPPRAAAPAAGPAMSMGMSKMKSGAAMPGMSAGAAPAPAMAGMGGGAGGSMNMMGMMDKMMGMMDKMMPMGGGAMPAGAPMAGGGMGMMQSEMGGMGGGGAMPAAPAAGMSGGGGMGMMDDDKMEMAGMMGMGAMSGPATGAMPQSALPGFPGASHLYHIGATGFFLDHPQHIALTTEQQGALNSAREQALLAKSTADRAVEQAEQELWTLTAADQPDAAVIETKLTEIGKLRGDERLAFIRTVGEASKLLTDEQRKSLTGFAPPAPAAAPMAGGMTDM